LKRIQCEADEEKAIIIYNAMTAEENSERREELLLLSIMIQKYSISDYHSALQY